MRVVYDITLRAYEFHWRESYVVVPNRDLKDFVVAVAAFGRRNKWTAIKREVEYDR